MVANNRLKKENHYTSRFLSRTLLSHNRCTSFPTIVSNANCPLINHDYDLFKFLPRSSGIAFSSLNYRQGVFRLPFRNVLSIATR